MIGVTRSCARSRTGRHAWSPQPVNICPDVSGVQTYPAQKPSKRKPCASSSGPLRRHFAFSPATVRRSNSIINSCLTWTVPPAMLSGVIPKSRCFNANLPLYHLFCICARTEIGFLIPCNENSPSTLILPSCSCSESPAPPSKTQSIFTPFESGSGEANSMRHTGLS